MASMGDAQRVGQGGLSKLTDGPRTTSDLSKVGGGLTRGPSQAKKLNAAAWSETWPAPGSTLDLDFANDRGWVRGVGQGKSMDAVTFTGASNRNYVNPDGTLSSHANQGALGNNLLTFPQDFDNAAWAKSNSSVVANTEIAPDGTLTADKIIENTANQSHTINQSVTFVSGQAYCFSIYAKGEQRFLQLVPPSQMVALGYANFDLVNGIITASGGSGIITDIENIGDGWWRCLVAVNSAAASGSGTPTVGIVNDATDGRLSAYTGDGESGIFIWGAQLEVGSTATEYFPTNIGQPRFDWASTAQLPQNLITFSEAFDTAGWTKTNVTLVSGKTDPDGGTSAYEFTAAATNADIRKATSFSATGQEVCNSLYVRRVSGTGNVLLLNPSGGSFTTITPTSTWQRFSTSQSGRTGNINVGVRLATSGDVIEIAFAQAELGLTPTTYFGQGAYLSANTPLAANPTSNGLLIEEARTNRILWCRDATQANWVSTNVTAAKDQTGIDGVANAASSLTATANDGTCIQTITLASGSRTGSVYLKRITGTGNVQVSLDGSTYSTVDLSASEWRRIVLSGTVTNPTVGIKLAVSGDAVAMDYGQVEDGAFVTTPILTTTASVTRAEDITSISLDVSVSVLNFVSGSAIVNFNPYTDRISATERNIISVGGVNGYLNFFNTTAGRFGLRAAGDVNNGLSNAIFANTETILVASWSIKARSRASSSGVFDQYYSISSPFPPQNFSRVAAINSTTKRVIYWPFEMNLTQIQELTK
jgi:hypothetical protein